MSRQVSILYTPENPTESRRHATISAAYPGAILPMSSRPKFLAPPSVAIFRASCAPMAGQTHSNHTVVQYHAACLLCHMLLVTYAPAIICSKHVSFGGGVYGPCNALCRDSPVADPVARCSSMASRTSCSRWPESLEAEPSTPMPTLTLVSSSFLTGAMPVARPPWYGAGQRDWNMVFLRAKGAGVAAVCTNKWAPLLSAHYQSQRLLEFRLSPEARRRLDEGQCETPMPLLANCRISLSSSIQQ